MDVQIPTGTVFNVTLSTPQEARYIIELAAARAREAEGQAALEKVYTMKELPTRLNISRNTIYQYLQLPVKKGGLRSRRAGNKWLVTEKACREWLGDDKPEK